MIERGKLLGTGTTGQLDAKPLHNPEKTTHWEKPTFQKGYYYMTSVDINGITITRRHYLPSADEKRARIAARRAANPSKLSISEESREDLVQAVGYSHRSSS